MEAGFTQIKMFCCTVSSIEVNSQVIKRFIAAHFDEASEAIEFLHGEMLINSREKDGYVALYWEVLFSNHTDVVDELLTNGADMNVRNSYG